MYFVAIDVETANSDMSSICQIGLACYENETLCKEWVSYINPQDYFDGINISIHGIDEDMVRNAPILTAILGNLYNFLDNKIAVCHTHFDRVAIRQAFDKYKVRQPECIWLDTARVARRVWEEFAWCGYGLANICDKIGYKFKHHDALEDAKAAGTILLKAISISGLDIEGWIKRVKQPIDDKLGHAITREGNPEGPFYAEVIVFTGVLQIPRKQAADMAAKIGCQVNDNVTKDTTILVVGDQDVKKLAGNIKSSKHRKAEDLIAKGHKIRILRESDFKELFSLVD